MKLLKQRDAVASSVVASNATPFHDGGLLTVIAGRPRWRSSQLEDLASARSDSVALAHAYRHSGVDFCDLLTGTFALAILDERADRTVLAIDRFGIGSLCYALSPDNHLVFGPTADTVADLAGSRPLSAQSVYRYLYYHVVPSPDTIYQDVFKLEPGQIVEYHGGIVQTRQYWRPVFARRAPTAIKTLERDLIAVLRSSVRRTAPNGNTGAFLSGGLDSTTICGMAQEYSDGQLTAYTASFPQPGYDESHYARIASECFGLDLRDFLVTPGDVAQTIPVVAAAYDEPFGNSSAVPAYLCAVRAVDDGLTSLLAGDGGDELFGGNQRYAKQQLFELYRRLPGTFRERLLEPLLFSPAAELTKLTRKGRSYVEQARLPMPERLQTYNFLHMVRPEKVLSSSFNDIIDVELPIREMRTWYSRCEDSGLINRMLQFDWKLTLADNDLRKVNRMCQAAGITVQYPFLDDEVVEFSTRVPSDLKIRRYQLRHFYKKALSGYLPRRIIDKEKHGFGLPFGEWLRTDRTLRNRAENAFASLGERGIFRNTFLDDLLAKHRDEHAAFYGNIVWVVMMLEEWLQAHRPDTTVRTLV